VAQPTYILVRGGQEAKCFGRAKNGMSSTPEVPSAIEVKDETIFGEGGNGV